MLQVAHKASTRARQRWRSAETRSRRPHVQPFSFISLSTVLLQVSLGRPLFLWPSGVHRRAILVKAVVCCNNNNNNNNNNNRSNSTPEKSRRKRESNPGSFALEADALTTRPTRRSSSQPAVCIKCGKYIHTWY